LFLEKLVTKLNIYSGVNRFEFTEKYWYPEEFRLMELLRRVALVRIDVSEEHIASIIRVKRIGELGTTLASC
jgi:hypothetical protein